MVISVARKMYSISPGLGKAELDRRVNESKSRADFHKIDPFGTPLDPGAEVLLKHIPEGRKRHERSPVLVICSRIRRIWKFSLRC
jgi:hypothetical protein